MKQITIPALIILNIVFSSANLITKSVEDKNRIYENIEDFKKKNPDIELIPMEMKSFEDSRTYTLGRRQTGDVVVANGSDKKRYSVPQNVTTTLTYPSSGGNGAYLTFIQVNCEQSSNIGQAYVTSGGVNQHFIQIVIEARVTNYFNYAAFFYGVK